MKIIILNQLSSCMVGICTFAATALFAANPPPPPTPLSVSAADECTRELLLAYFPTPIVMEALKHFNVPQDKWDDIAKSLSAKEKDVVKRVEQKAAQMTPNPLKDPQQRQAAVKLFRETLLQVFAEAMQENGVTDTSKFQAMLDDIQQQKAKKFAMCMERQKQRALQQGKGESENQGNAEDDEDEDNYEDENDNDDNDKYENDDEEEEREEGAETKSSARIVKPQPKSSSLK